MCDKIKFFILIRIIPKLWRWTWRDCFKALIALQAWSYPSSEFQRFFKCKSKDLKILLVQGQKLESSSKSSWRFEDQTQDLFNSRLSIHTLCECGRSQSSSPNTSLGHLTGQTKQRLKLNSFLEELEDHIEIVSHYLNYSNFNFATNFSFRRNIYW